MSEGERLAELRRETVAGPVVECSRSVLTVS
jgi:hypothetical protein